MRGQYDKPRYSGSVVAFGLCMQACAASPLIPCGITNYAATMLPATLCRVRSTCACKCECCATLWNAFHASMPS